MKVIKASPAKAWTKRIKCTGVGNGGGGCKSTLEIVKTDIFGTDSYHYDGSHETYITIECPICKAWTDLKDIPSQIIDHNMPRRSRSWTNTETPTDNSDK